MSIDGIAALGSISPLGAVRNVNQMADPNPVAANGASGPDFGAMVAQGLQKLQAVQNNADNLAVEAATGRLTDVHDYIIAATEANLATSLTVAVRNRALDAFNEIMRMQA